MPASVEQRRAGLAVALHQLEDAVRQPRCLESSATRRPEKGVTSEGFSTTALPAISACTVGLSDRMNGKFHGVMMPTTPSGR